MLFNTNPTRFSSNNGTNGLYLSFSLNSVKT